MKDCRNIVVSDSDLRKAVDIIPRTNFILSEFLAMLIKEKPAVVRGIEFIRDIRLVRASFPKLFISHRKYPPYRQTLYSVARSKEAADSAIKYVSASWEDQGKVLGYPVCCSKRHAIRCSSVDKKEKMLDLDVSAAVFDSFLRSTSYHYLLNNLFNFSSRISMEETELTNYDNYRRRNDHIFQFPSRHLQYISHIPCKYDCRESIKIGRAVKAVLSNYASVFNKEMIDSLSKPVLFFATLKAVVFDGFVRGDTVFYKGILPPLFPLADRFVRSLKLGDRVTVLSDSITIYNKTSVILKLVKKNPENGFLINFASLP